jgi:thymidylate synthase (FAD)
VEKAMENCEKSYFDLLQIGATPQEARSVLPNSLKTELFMTMNIREWRHFFKLRCSSAAHPQMQQIAKMILEKFREKYPFFVKDLAIS